MSPNKIKYFKTTDANDLRAPSGINKTVLNLFSVVFNFKIKFFFLSYNLSVEVRLS